MDGPDVIRKERVDGGKGFCLENSQAIYDRIILKTIFRIPFKTMIEDEMA